MERKVKVGDIIRVTTDPDYYLAFAIGQEVKVVGIHNDGRVEAKGTSTTHGGIITQTIHPEDFELVEK